jgi:hypothetical protein
MNMETQQLSFSWPDSTKVRLLFEHRWGEREWGILERINDKGFYYVQSRDQQGVTLCLHESEFERFP